MRKFIVTHTGTLKYGDVRMHKDLLRGKEMCIGGGYYEFDYISNRLLLSGESYDFGKPKWNYIDELKVPSSLQGLTILYEGQDIRSFVDVKFV